VVGFWMKKTREEESGRDEQTEKKQMPFQLSRTPKCVCVRERNSDDLDLIFFFFPFPSTNT
jgi:hypothetical protein